MFDSACLICLYIYILMATDTPIVKPAPFLLNTQKNRIQRVWLTRVLCVPPRQWHINFAESASCIKEDKTAVRRDTKLRQAYETIRDTYLVSESAVSTKVFFSSSSDFLVWKTLYQRGNMWGKYTYREYDQKWWHFVIAFRGVGSATRCVCVTLSFPR